jgi:hypothetical protein
MPLASFPSSQSSRTLLSSALDEHLAGVQISEESALDRDLPGLRGVNRKPNFFDDLL